MNLVELAPLVVAFWLLLVGLYGCATTRNLMHLVLCVSVAHSGVWVLLVGLSHEDGRTGPVIDEEIAAGQGVADPMLQALTVTDVVVGVAVTALLLACVVRIQGRFGTLDPAEIEVLRG